MKGKTAEADVAGSSPRGRGKRVRRLGGRGNRGLIPAWAGKTARRGEAFGDRRAHPRVGGENPSSSACTATGPGSSPRGRGKRLSCADDRLDLGLIPAWAGKTARAVATPSWRRAHPRVGGENRRAVNTSSSADGSSPRGRGKPRSRPGVNMSARLIPAWAGKTSEWP